MSAILKYISRISLILLVLVSATSCTRWHEAKEVIAAADSLLAKSEVIEDTAALAWKSAWIRLKINNNFTSHPLHNAVGVCIKEEDFFFNANV